MRRQLRSCARHVDPARAAQRTRSRPRTERAAADLAASWRRFLPLELGGERHRASAATGAAHGDENVLLLLLVEVGAIEQLPGLLFEQRVQREGAIRNLILRRGLRSGLPCRRDAPNLAAPVLALRPSCLRRLANGSFRLQADLPDDLSQARRRPDPRRAFFLPTRMAA